MPCWYGFRYVLSLVDPDGTPTQRADQRSGYQLAIGEVGGAWRAQ